MLPLDESSEELSIKVEENAESLNATEILACQRTCKTQFKQISATIRRLKSQVESLRTTVKEFTKILDYSNSTAFEDVIAV